MSVNLLIGRSRVAESFMIDTGADYTIVQRQAVLPLLKAAGVKVGPESSREDVVLSGVGPVPLTCIVQPAGLGLINDGGEEFTFANPILVPRPSSVRELARGRVKLPSLLGRDVLQYFDLHLSYDPPSVTLTLND